MTAAQANQPTDNSASDERGPLTILRGFRDGMTTVLLFAHEPGAKTHGHGFVNTGAGNRNVIFFFNDRDGKKSITLKEFVRGEGDGDGHWNVVGFGNAMNRRADGKEVYFDTVLFNVDGKTLEARLTKAGEAFAEQIGFAQARVARPRAEPAAEAEDEAPTRDRGERMAG